jgi:myo-inositol-1(or 4)-monophosphatase
MLARGDLGGIVQYNSGGIDLFAGLLLAQEAGAVITDFDGNPPAPVEGDAGVYLVAAHPAHHGELLELVRNNLRQ